MAEGPSTGGAAGIALMRGVPPTLDRCELTFRGWEPFDLDRAIAQHASYADLLRSLGLEVVELPTDPAFPDCCFVEDVAVVLDEVALLGMPTPPSRRGEIAAVEEALARFRALERTPLPATLEGGDVLRVGRRVFAGLSARSNPEGIEQLRVLLSPHGYTVEALPISGCLHLKSAVTQVGPETVLLNPQWVDKGAFERYQLIEVDPAEPHAANALLVGGGVIYPTAFPLTAARLERAGVRLEPVNVSELTKAEGAVTCCSLILEE